MRTILTKDPVEAAQFIRSGGIVAFPTETVYGLGADAFNETAIAHIFEAKLRPADNPLIAHISDRSQIGLLVSEVPEYASKLIEAFFPGPLTLVMKKQSSVPLIATAGLDSVGVRMPGNVVASEFLKACGRPAVAPSANLSGRPSPTTWEAVFEDLDGRIDCILQGDATEIGIESTVVDCMGRQPVILRAGAVTTEQVESVVGDVAEVDSVDPSGPKSPGMRHRHYSPRAKVILVSPGVKIENAGAFIGLHRPKDLGESALVRICGSSERYAHEFFEFFRECDRSSIDVIYCETVEETGIGAALMDRLRRAAEN
ncbi:MAG TPA: L-threonylcarbamoyladenylate synthase [Pyrinomonadaceae bacterium]|jgi:L-threonylcarbamoyladenylate synthase|nr:L-threonylcarbamoyladenylate synthase [Pyrinomonadaceae bacterium]